MHDPLTLAMIVGGTLALLVCSILSRAVMHERRAERERARDTERRRRIAEAERRRLRIEAAARLDRESE